jgi:gliding motility-associated-like protein
MHWHRNVIPYRIKTTNFNTFPYLYSKKKQTLIDFSAMRKYALTSLFVMIGLVSFAQEIIDSCFFSVEPGINFVSSDDLANNSSIEADVLEWSGTEWIGGWLNANISIPPPGEGVGCRAIFIGNGQTWTSGGEGFGLRVSEFFNAGQTYNFDITYVSQGLGSDGAFSPSVYTNSIPSISGGTFVGNLPAVGYSWETNTFSFTVTAAQSGHQWILIHTELTGTSGLINSFCEECQDCSSFPENFYFGPDITLCEGESVVLDATTLNSTYTWQDGSSSPSLTVTAEGTYAVTITNICGVLSDEINVYFSTPLVPIDLGEDVDLCIGDSLLLDVTTPGVNYQWQDNSVSPTYDIAAPGLYWVELSNVCGLVADSIFVTYTSPPFIDLGGDLELCPGETALLDITGVEGILNWHDSSNGPTFLITQPGVYWVEATNHCGIDSDTMEALYFEPPQVDLGPDTIICLDETLLLEVNLTMAEYLWQDNSTDAAFLVTAPGDYAVTVTNLCGIDSSAIQVEFDNCTLCDIYIPNVFSPNDDGRNDAFTPLSNCNLEDYQLSIFSRWGEQLFTTNDPNQSWNGKFRGSLLPPGVYVFQIEFRYLRGVKKIKTGSITLIR